jgi:Ni/Co efflux regulator RcnB
MRKYLLSALLVTSVAMPAMAQEQEDSGRHRHNESSAVADSGGQRPERAQRAERERPQAGEQGGWSPRAEGRQRVMQQQQAQEPAFQQPAMRQQGERRAWAQRRQERGDAIQPQGFTPPAPQNEVAPMQRYGRTREGFGARGGFGTRDGFGARDATGQNRTNWTQTDRSGSRYARTGGQWSNQWRTNRDYDWRRHRDSHRSLYRLGYYRDPYGSRYRRFSIGFSLFPSYYQSNYWLDDPYMYRLPQAYGPYRWVRYYGDALLVNIYTGQVVDVVYDFFW